MRTRALRGVALRRAAEAICAAAAALCLGAAVPAPANAQGTLSGRVTGPEGEPVDAALVKATGQSGAARETRTGADGRYELPLPDDGGSFTVSAERLGFLRLTVVVARPPGATLLSRDLRLSASATMLPQVQASSRRQTLPVPQRGPGGTDQFFTPITAQRLPLDPGDFGDLAILTPGAVPLGEGGGDAPAFSVAGQAPEANGATVDGARHGGGSLPSEAVAAAGIVTGTYDVSRGRFTGGQMNATTLSGTDRPGASFMARGRHPVLQWGASPKSGIGEQTWWSAGGGGGGPLVRGRLFAYGAGQLSHRSTPVLSLGSADAGTLRRLGVSGDSVARFREILGRAGVPVPPAREDAAAEQGTGMTRLDWEIGGGHVATLRMDGRFSHRSGPASALSLTGGEARYRAGSAGAMGQLVSEIGAGANALRVYASRGWWRTDETEEIPAGRVRVGTDGIDGAVRTLAFGGGGAAGHGSSRSLEVTDALTARLGARHRLKAGIQYGQEETDATSEGDRLGTFTFASLDDLEAGRAASFTRTLGARRRTAATAYAGAWLGDIWQAGPDLSLTFGVRMDGSWYPARLPFDTAAAAAFGSPGRIPASASLSPRLGFTWSIRSPHDVLSRLTVRGGVGRFAGEFSPSALAGALSETGTGGGERLSCVGPAAPIPDWPAYLGDPETLPEVCASGAPSFSQRAAALTVWSPEFRAPGAWHGSLAFDWEPVRRYTLRAEAKWVRGMGEPVAFDANLSRAPEFFLGDEERRPFYAPPAAVDPATGGVAPGIVRLHPKYGVVRRMESTGRASATQLNVGLTAWPGGGSRVIRAWYSYTRSRDQVGALPSVGGSAPSIGGDPFVLQGGTADFERRHSFLVYLSGLATRSLGLGVVGRVTSGAPYTPLVSGDVNGDGAFNDRAFVFDPVLTADTAVAGAMRELLASSSARTCLRRWVGQVAGRNGCRGPWSGAVDLKASLYPGRLGAEKRLVVSATATNVAAGLDRLLHGAEGMRGWGGEVQPDPVLLHVRGFDPSERAFRYEVNRAFGASAGRRPVYAPFALTLQVRVSVGADPAYQGLDALIAAGRAYARPLDELRRDLALRIPNPPRLVLALAPSLAREPLSDSQLEALRMAGDSVQVRIDALLADFAAAVSAADTASGNEAPARARAMNEAAWVVVDNGLEEVRRILAPDQFALLPAHVRRPPRGQPFFAPRPLVIPFADP